MLYALFEKTTGKIYSPSYNDIDKVELLKMRLETMGIYGLRIGKVKQHG